MRQILRRYDILMLSWGNLELKRDRGAITYGYLFSIYLVRWLGIFSLRDVGNVCWPRENGRWPAGTDAQTSDCQPDLKPGIGSGHHHRDSVLFCDDRHAGWVGQFWNNGIGTDRGRDYGLQYWDNANCLDSFTCRHRERDGVGAVAEARIFFSAAGIGWYHLDHGCQKQSPP